MRAMSNVHAGRKSYMFYVSIFCRFPVLPSQSYMFRFSVVLQVQQKCLRWISLAL